ncbi:MAG: M1 family metallopeptidase [Bacteroidota bacterium]|jgi:aminopeptidase N
MRQNIPFKQLLIASLVIMTACSPSKKTTSENNQVNAPAPAEPAATPELIEYRASDPIMHDLIHTKLEVSFDWPQKELIGKAKITLKPHFYPQSMLYLDARGMDIKSVRMVHSKTSFDLDFEYRNDSICITLDKVYSPKDTINIAVDYVAKPEALPKGGSDAIASDKGLYFINADGSDPKKPRQIWTQGETQSSSVWFPTIDRPNQNTTQEIYITVDTSFVTLSNGKLISSTTDAKAGTRTDYWKQDLPHAPYLFMMAIGKYAVVKDYWKGMEVSYYVEPEYEAHARGIFNHTPEMLEFFSKKFGVDYPWEKYAQVVVRDFVSGAMENTSASIFGEFVQKDDRELHDATNDDIVAHELSHHWFGDLVTCESWSNLPLNESFATYCEYLWNEYKYGRDEADWALNSDLKSYLQEARTKQVDLIRFEYDDKEDMFDRHSYQKGGRILHMLRNAVGDEAFFAALKIYLDENRFKPVEVHHLRLAFEKATGRDMNWFFNQWFLDKGHPIIEISYDYQVETNFQKVTITQKQDFANTPLYTLPLEIDIYTSSGVKRHSVTMRKSSETFEFKVDAKPLLVNVDAKKLLLCTKIDNHSDEEFAYMFRHAPLLMDRLESLSRFAKDAKPGTMAGDILTEALNDSFWGIRSTAVKSAKGMASSQRAKLMEMASNDPHPAVRRDALDLLASVFPGDQELLILANKSVNDKSYRVMQSAIGYILDSDKERGLGMVKEMETTTNPNLQAMVSTFYVKHGGDGQFGFMTSNLDNAKGFDAYSAVQAYGKFLMRCGPKNAMDGIISISKQAFSHPQWFVRLAAAQALAELGKSYGKSTSSDPIPVAVEGVRKKADELLAEVKAKETDPNLLRFFNR